MSAVAAAIKELREQRAEFAAKVAGLDECIAVLERMGVKAPGPMSAAARQAKALARKKEPPAPSKEERLELLRKRAVERKEKAPLPSGGDSGRIMWKTREGFVPWRKKLLEPVFAHPRGSAERGRAYVEVAQKVHTAPDGVGSAQISIASLRGWVYEIESAEEQSDDAAVEATPAAASQPEASRQVCVLPNGLRHPDVPRAVTLSVRDMERERSKAIREGTHRALRIVENRPLTRGECVDAERPCPYVACRHHLYLDVDPDTGSLKLNFPHLEPEQLEHSCALDVADRGGVTLEVIGNLTNIIRERVRQIETKALGELRENAEAFDLDLRGVELGQYDPMESMPETISPGDASDITRAFAKITHARLAERERAPTADTNPGNGG